MAGKSDQHFSWHTLDDTAEHPVFNYKVGNKGKEEEARRNRIQKVSRAWDRRLIFQMRNGEDSSIVSFARK